LCAWGCTFVHACVQACASLRGQSSLATRALPRHQRQHPNLHQFTQLSEATSVPMRSRPQQQQTSLRQTN
jgi:hypothetical protein